MPIESSLEEAQYFKTIICQYVEASSQKVNVDKLEIFFISTKLELENQICNIMGYEKG